MSFLHCCSYLTHAFKKNQKRSSVRFKCSVRLPLASYNILSFVAHQATEASNVLLTTQVKLIIKITTSSCHFPRTTTDKGETVSHRTTVERTARSVDSVMQVERIVWIVVSTEEIVTMAGEAVTINRVGKIAQNVLETTGRVMIRCQI